MASQAFLEKAYLAYFGRPVDPSGAFAYANTSEATVLTSFSSSAESVSLYGSTFGYAQINAIYQMLFNRDADIAGANFYLARVGNGTSTVAGVALDILNGAQNTDVTVINNKITASRAFTASLDTIPELVGYQGNAAAAAARDYLKTVTTTAATQAAIDAAVASAVSVGGVSGSTFTLTTGVDTITGTSGNDSFVATDTTYTSADSINGGAGTDTLTLTLTDTNTAVATVAGVENIVISDYNGDTVNATNWSGVTGLTVQNGTAATTISNVGFIPTLTLANQNLGVTYTAKAATVAGAADSMTVNAGGYGITGTVPALSIAGIETLNLNSTAANNFTISDSSLKTVTVTGSGAVTLSGAALPTSVTSFSAAGATGAVSVDLTGSTLTSVTGGSANDTILLSTTAVGTTTIDGGAGTDTLGLNIANVAAALATTSKISNVETLKIQNANTLTAAETIALGNVTGLTNIRYGALLTVDNGPDNAYVETITGLVSGSEIRFDASTANTLTDALSAGTTAAQLRGGLVATLTGAASGTNDTLNLKFTKGASSAAAEALVGLTANNVENINVNVTSLTGNTTTIDGIADAQLGKLTITSSAVDSSSVATDAANLTVAGTTSFTTTLLNTVDLSGYRAATTGVVTVTGLSSSLISTGAVITGPSKGYLVATGGAGPDTITTGAGGSNSSTGITGGAGADTINLSASTAKVDILTVGASDSTDTAYDLVTGFTTATTTGDKLDLAGTNAVKSDVAVGTATGVTNLTASVTSGIMTFGGSAAETATLAQRIAAAEHANFANSATYKVVAFEYQGNTYVVGSGASTAVSSDDTVVELVGLTGVTSLSASASGAHAIFVV